MLVSDPAWLTGTLPDGSPARWLLDQDVLALGRRAPADLILPYAPVSRRHAEIVYRDWGYHIADLGSRNGTFVNGEPLVATPRRLVDGDEIVVGGVVVLVFHDPDETMAGPRVGRLQGIWLDPSTQQVWVDAVRLEPPLSSAQLALLTLLYEDAGAPVSQAAIIAAVWPDEDPQGVSKQAVEGLVKRLRARLRDAGAGREYVQVVRGFGLRLVRD